MVVMLWVILKVFDEHFQWIGHYSHKPRKSEGLVGLPHHIKQTPNRMNLGSICTCQTNPRSMRLMDLASFHLDNCIMMLIQKSGWKTFLSIVQVAQYLWPEDGWLFPHHALQKKTWSNLGSLTWLSSCYNTCQENILETQVSGFANCGLPHNNTQHTPDVCLLDCPLLRK